MLNSRTDYSSNWTGDCRAPVLYHETSQSNELFLSLIVRYPIFRAIVLSAIPALFRRCVDRQICSERHRGSFRDGSSAGAVGQLSVLKREDWPELVAPVVGLKSMPTLEQRSRRQGVLCSESGDVTGLLRKRHPLVEAISERNGVEISSSQVDSRAGHRNTSPGRCRIAYAEPIRNWDLPDSHGKRARAGCSVR